MLFKNMTKVGFYTRPEDTDRETIFEVFKNTDTVWLKEEPEAKLLVDTWYYSHTDADEIKHYYTSGVLTVLRRENQEGEIEVEEITDTKYIINDATMREDKLTYKQKYEIIKDKLEKIKPILEYYANSKMGELQFDGTYKFMYATNDFGVESITYNPRPAKEGLGLLESEIKDGTR